MGRSSFIKKNQRLWVSYSIAETMHRCRCQCSAMQKFYAIIWGKSTCRLEPVFMWLSDPLCFAFLNLRKMFFLTFFRWGTIWNGCTRTRAPLWPQHRRCVVSPFVSSGLFPYCMGSSIVTKGSSVVIPGIIQMKQTQRSHKLQSGKFAPGLLCSTSQCKSFQTHTNEKKIRMCCLQACCFLAILGLLNVVFGKLVHVFLCDTPWLLHC